MENHIEAIGLCPLFEGISRGELQRVLRCIGAAEVSVRPGSYLLLAGERPQQIGVVLEGSLQVERQTPSGDSMIIAALGPGDIYAEALCCAGAPESPVSVRAASRGAVLKIPFGRHIIHTCQDRCAGYSDLVLNMTEILAQKSLFLQRRVDVLGQRSIRQKVLSYLEGVEHLPGQVFRVPLDRGAMAEYLAVDRSALSRELSALRRDGLLDYHKNAFRLLREKQH